MPWLVALLALSVTASAFIYHPLPINNVASAPGSISPALWSAAGKQCLAGYSCEPIQTVCDEVLEFGWSVATIEATLEDASAGTVFCAALDFDLSASQEVLTIRRDCSSARCWLVPVNAGSRTRDASSQASPKLFSLQIDGNAHNWAVVGFSVDSRSVAGVSGVEVGSASPADDVLLAYNHIVGAGGAGIHLVNAPRAEAQYNVIELGAVIAGTDTQAIRADAGADIKLWQNTLRDWGGGAGLVVSAHDSLIYANAYELTGALRTDCAAGAAPTGSGECDCAGPYAELLGNGGEFFGNIASGKRRNLPACGGTEGTGVGVIVGSSWDVHSNALFDTVSGFSGGAGSTISANFVELHSSADAATEVVGFDPDFAGSTDQVFAFNTILCAAPGAVHSLGSRPWSTGAADADIKYNLFIGCDAPDGAAETGSKSLQNVYSETATGSAEVPDVDDTANALYYGGFAIWSELCDHSTAPCRVHVFEGVTPVLGGALDDLYSSPTYSAGRGANAPRSSWAE